jgi:hypothetical protein
MEDPAMYSRCLAIAAALMLAAPGAAEPLKPVSTESAKPAGRPAAVMLASAEQVQAPPAVSQAQTPQPAKRPRAARVTTCRCGGQNADLQVSEDQ